MLKKGGVLIISDANNAANPVLRLRRKIYWYKQERKTNIHKRKKVINEKYSQLGHEELESLTVGTANMSRDQIMLACEDYFKTGVHPNSKYKWGMVTIDPENNMFEENLFNPKQSARKLEELGFEIVKIDGLFGQLSNSKMKRILSSILLSYAPLSLLLLETVILIARKK